MRWMCIHARARARAHGAFAPPVPERRDSVGTIVGVWALPAWVLLGAWMLLAARPASAAINWLDVRRRGAAGVIDAAVAAEGAPARATHYVCDSSTIPGWSGVQLEVARRPLPGKRAGTQLVVVLRDAKGAFLAGVANDGKGVWVRHGSGKPQADNTLLFRDVPGLGVPLALFAGLELTGRYESRLEGEFDGSAILRLQPGYTEQAGLEPLKLGVSKQTLLVSISEIDDSKGVARARLLMIHPREHDRLVIHEQLRLRLQNREKPVDLIRVRHDLGKVLRKKWGPAALR